MSRRVIPGSRSTKGRGKYESVPQDIDDEEAVDRVANLRGRRKAADSESEESIDSNDERNTPAAKSDFPADLNAESRRESTPQKLPENGDSTHTDADANAHTKPVKRGYLRNREEQKWENHSLKSHDTAQHSEGESWNAKASSKDRASKAYKWEAKKIQQRPESAEQKASVSDDNGGGHDGDEVDAYANSRKEKVIHADIDTESDNDSRDGQEVEGDEEKDENAKNDPTIIPRKQKYFMHDDRSKSGGRPPRRRNKENSWEPAEGGKWTHDKFAQQDSSDKQKKGRRARHPKGSSQETQDAERIPETIKDAKHTPKQPNTKAKEPISLVVTIVTKNSVPPTQETPTEVPQSVMQPLVAASKKYSSRRAQAQNAEPVHAQTEYSTPLNTTANTGTDLQATQISQQSQEPQQTQPPVQAPEHVQMKTQPPSSKEFPHPREQLRAGSNALDIIFPPSHSHQPEGTHFTGHNLQDHHTTNQHQPTPHNQYRLVQERPYPNHNSQYNQSENLRGYSEYPPADVYQNTYPQNRSRKHMPPTNRPPPAGFEPYAWYPPSNYPQMPPNYYYYQDIQPNRGYVCSR